MATLLGPTLSACGGQDARPAEGVLVQEFEVSDEALWLAEWGWAACDSRSGDPAINLIGDIWCEINGDGQRGQEEAPLLLLTDNDKVRRAENELFDLLDDLEGIDSE